MAKQTISVCKGRGSINHNNREFSTQNVDQDKTKDNIIYKQEPIEKAYEKLFGEEVRRYNEGKKPCRQISNYMEHIKNSKNGEKLFFENVIQVGDKFSASVGSAEGESAKQILDRYMKDFQKRNPNLYVFNAVMHLDEATPHLHIDYIPVAHGYQKGLMVRNSLDKALKEQGIDGKANKKENSTHNWQENEKKALEEVMKEFGIEKKAEKGLHREHLSVDQYKAVAEQIHNEVKTIPKQIETAPTLTNKQRVTVDKGDLAELEKRAKLSLVHEKATKKLEAELQASMKGKYESAEKKLEQAENTLSRAEQRERQAEIKLTEATERGKEATMEAERYKSLYREQKGLNEENKALKAEVQRVRSENKDLQQSISTLQAENRSLRVQIADLKRSIEVRVQEALEPLKEQIQGFMDKMQGMAETTRNVTRAVSWIDKAFNNKKLHEVCEAVQDYSEHWLGEDGFDEMANGVREPDLSKGIKNFMEPEYNKIVYIKGDGQNYGWYSSKEEGHVFLGKKADLKDLMEKYPNAKFSDPFDHVPELHSVTRGG